MVCRARSRLAHLCQGPRAQVPRAQVNLCVKLIFSINPKELSMNDSVNTAVEEFSDEEYQQDVVGRPVLLHVRV